MPQPSEPLDELNRYLRAGAGSEILDEAAITELETHQGRLRRRTMADVARGIAERGDSVRLAVPRGELTGLVVHVGKDYMSVDTDHLSVDVRYSTCTWSIVKSPSGGTTLSKGSVTLKARLAEFEQTGEVVTIVVGESEHRGVIAVAASDHILLIVDSIETVVPLNLVDLIVRPRSDTHH